MTRILSVLFCILATMAVCAAQSVVYFPQIAEGVQSGGIQWGMVIAITNLGEPVTSGTLTLVKDDGTPFFVNLTQYGAQSGSGSQSSFPFQLAPQAAPAPAPRSELDAASVSASFTSDPATVSCIVCSAPRGL